MNDDDARKAAQAFVEDYTDPEIDKRLYFDVWADRSGLSALQARHVWREVRRLAYRGAAEKRRRTWRMRRSTKGQRTVSATDPAPVAHSHAS